MIAIPIPLVIQGDEGKVDLLQALQGRLAFVLAGNGVAKRATETVQDRGLQQEIPGAFRSLLQNFIGEIVQNEPVTTGEIGDEIRQVVATLHR
jgi:hypothetical protein